MNKKITYKLVPLNIEVNKLEDAVVPNLNERKIEKHGEVIYFSLKDIEDNLIANAKTRKEVEAKLELETAKRDNVLHFNPFINDLTPEQIHAVHMYKESLIWIEDCESKLISHDKQNKIDNDEIAEIKKQLPFLSNEN